MAARLDEGTAVVGGVSAHVRSPVLAVTSDDVSQLFCSFLRLHLWLKPLLPWEKPLTDFPFVTRVWKFGYICL